MAASDFSIGDKNFKLRKIHAMKQYQIVRKIAPILAEFLPAVKDMAKIQKSDADMTDDEKWDQLAKVASPILIGLSKLSEEDSQKVLTGLLEAAEIQQEQGNWAKVASNGQILFDNLPLKMLLQIAWYSFSFNLSDFFAVLPRV